MSKKPYNELLQISRKKIELGDTLMSVRHFLLKEGADEISIKKIFQLLTVEENKSKQTKQNPKNNKSKKWYVDLFLAASLLFIGISLIINKLSYFFGEDTKIVLQKKHFFIKYLYKIIKSLEGSFSGYLIGGLLTLTGIYLVYKTYLKLWR